MVSFPFSCNTSVHELPGMGFSCTFLIIQLLHLDTCCRIAQETLCISTPAIIHIQKCLIYYLDIMNTYFILCLSISFWWSETLNILLVEKWPVSNTYSHFNLHIFLSFSVCSCNKNNRALHGTIVGNHCFCGFTQYKFMTITLGQEPPHIKCLTT